MKSSSGYPLEHEPVCFGQIDVGIPTIPPPLILFYIFVVKSHLYGGLYEYTHQGHMGKIE